MYDLKFHIVGGHIKMKKTAFIKEMLGKDSTLRNLLDWRSTGDFNKKHPMVSDPDQDGYVTINFTNQTVVEVGEEYENYLKYLKDKYGSQVSGRVACRGSYGALFNFIIDLNSDNLIIKHQ